MPGPARPRCCPAAGWPVLGPLWPVDTEPYWHPASANGESWGLRRDHRPESRSGVTADGLGPGGAAAQGPWAGLWGRGPQTPGSCLAVQLLRVLPEAPALPLQRLQLLCRLVAGPQGASELALWGEDGEGLQPRGWRPGARAMQHLQVSDGGVQPEQPGPGRGAGVDAVQLFPDGGEEGASPLQVVQEQDHAVVAHCKPGRGSWGQCSEDGQRGTVMLAHGY